MGSRGAPLALGFALALSIASTALAAPTAAERETARRLMDEGRARIKANDPAHAIEAFQKAHEIVHVPTTGLALARAHLAAGHLVEARDAALEVGRVPREPGEPAVLDQARRQAKELEAGLKPRIPTVRVKAKGASKIAIDEVEVSPALIGEPVAVNPGRHVILARNAEGVEAHGELELAERDVKEIELTFASVASIPEKVKTTEAPRSVRAPTPAPADDRQAGGRTAFAKGLVYGGFTASAVGLGVGLATGAMTLSRASDLDPQCANDICAPSARSDLNSARTFATVSTIAFIVSAVGASAGVIGLVLPRRTARTTAAWPLRVEF